MLKLYHVASTRFDPETLTLDAPVRSMSHPNSALGVWCFADKDLAIKYAGNFTNDVNPEILELTIKKRASVCINFIEDWAKFCREDRAAEDYLKFRQVMLRKKQDIFGILENDGKTDTCCILNLEAIKSRVWL